MKNEVTYSTDPCLPTFLPVRNGMSFREACNSVEDSLTKIAKNRRLDVVRQADKIREIELDLECRVLFGRVAYGPGSVHQLLQQLMYGSVTVEQVVEMGMSVLMSRKSA